jgi:Rieske Fe-S protein
MKLVSRREVIKTFFLGAAFSNVIGNSWAASLVYEIRALSHIEAGVLEIKLSDFPELSAAGGSIRIGTSPVVRLSAEEIRQSGIFPPVIINRGTGETFYALSAECTHAGCSVQRLNSQGIMICPCHQSQFAADGSVRGGPARQPLRPLPFTRQADTLRIQMADTFYEVKAVRVPSSSRVQLSFLGFSEITYEVYFRSTFTGPPQRVHFATTPEGPLDQAEIAGNDDFANVYVERPGGFGFFQIAMKTRSV